VSGRAWSSILWTRLAPDIHAPDGGVPPRRLLVRWRVVKDPGMRRVVRRGVALAVPQLAHSVHVEVPGLDPGREYFFQFKYRDELSPVGRTITAPRRWDSVGSLAFAFASCQRWDEGYYSAYRRQAEEDLSFVVHLGDYLYEYGIDEHGGYRNVPVPEQYRPECETLERYRLQYNLYKSDPDLRRAHELFPWVVAWDDHEVDNDYAGFAPEGGEPNTAFTFRRAAAYQAFYAKNADVQVGRIVDALRARGLLDETLIVVTVDHAAQTGRRFHGRFDGFPPPDGIACDPATGSTGLRSDCKLVLRPRRGRGLPRPEPGDRSLPGRPDASGRGHQPPLLVPGRPRRRLAERQLAGAQARGRRGGARPAGRHRELLPEPRAGRLQGVRDEPDEPGRAPVVPAPR
jgi:hypothetical protein